LVHAISNSIESTPVMITKNDVTPSAPTQLAVGSSLGGCSVSWLPSKYDGGLPVERNIVEFARVPLEVGPMFSDTYWREIPVSWYQGDGSGPALAATVTFSASPTTQQCWVRVKAVNAKGSSPYVRKQWVG
jgi:hypothetical protein